MNLQKDKEQKRKSQFANQGKKDIGFLIVIVKTALVTVTILPVFTIKVPNVLFVFQKL